MPVVFGQDLRAQFAAAFAGDLYPATLTRVMPGAYDPENPGDGPSSSSAVFTCEGIAFAFEAAPSNGEQSSVTEFRVMLLLGSFKLAGVPADMTEPANMPRKGDTIAIARPGGSTSEQCVIESVKSLSNVAITCSVGGFLGG